MISFSFVKLRCFVIINYVKYKIIKMFYVIIILESEIIHDEKNKYYG